MEFVIHSFRHAHAILQQPEYVENFTDLCQAIEEISEEDLIRSFNSHKTPAKSLSRDINGLLKMNLKNRGWAVESAIFQDSDFDDKRWRLDFAKAKISVEVAFNHGEAIAWNLLKPVLASELNHVKKAIQTEIGVVICATEELKKSGQFDSAVGEFEKFIRYLEPLQDVLTVPMLIIGLKGPNTFEIVGSKVGSKIVGQVRKHS
jgi:Restriction endonuclease BglII